MIDPIDSVEDSDALRAARNTEVYALRRMMRDEIARSEVRAALSRRRFFRHPLIVTLIAVGLCFGVVTWVASSVMDRHAEDQLRREALSAVRDFSAIAAERTERMALLTASLERGARLDEVLERKQAYDDSYIAWNANLQKNYLYFREALGYTFETFVERAIDNSLSMLFADYHACLTEAYDRRLGRETRADALGPADGLAEGAGSAASRGLDAELGACLRGRGLEPAVGERAVETLHRRLRTCRDEIYGVLNHFVMKDIHCGAVTTWRPREQENGAFEPSVVRLTYEGLMRLCEIESAPPLPPVSDAEHEIFCTRMDEDGLLTRLGLPALTEMLAQEP